MADLPYNGGIGYVTVTLMDGKLKRLSCKLTSSVWQVCLCSSINGIAIFLETNKGPCCPDKWIVFYDWLLITFPCKLVELVACYIFMQTSNQISWNQPKLHGDFLFFTLEKAHSHVLWSNTWSNHVFSLVKQWDESYLNEVHNKTNAFLWIDGTKNDTFFSFLGVPLRSRGEYDFRGKVPCLSTIAGK